MKHCETWHNTCCLAKYKDACSLRIKPSACGLGWLMSAFMSARLSVSSVFSGRKHRSGVFWYERELHIYRVLIWLLPSHFQVPHRLMQSRCTYFFYRPLSHPTSHPKESQTQTYVQYFSTLPCHPSSGFWHLKPALFPQPREPSIINSVQLTWFGEKLPDIR